MAEDLVGDLHDLPGVDVHPAAAPELELDAPDGVHLLGPPTVDSDDDGRPDTAVDLAPSGSLDLATDLDGDGHVDVLTTVDAAGTARTVTVTPAAWEQERWDEGVPPPAPVLDPASGRWVRSPRS